MTTAFLKELHWAAGFLEGEGSFGYYVRSLTVQAAQNERGPLERVQRVLGGTIIQVRPKGKRTHWRWRAFQSRAAQVMMTVHCLLSERRQGQIEQALSRWKLVSTLHANRVKKRCHGDLPEYAEVFKRGTLP